ncbi:hypothetical protein GCK32_005999 [Trichostrongylus colubriformis]|uniref:Uncharacterized protein n=1 Tax=Trichostrongylus colubriformis TaxID=6319 RepID=A0AAN8FLE3_TRICO
MECEDRSEKVKKATPHELDKKQMELARAKMKKRADAREVARQEEKNWVEFRKLQVLYDCRPKSRAASRREDDVRNDIFQLKDLQRIKQGELGEKWENGMRKGRKKARNKKDKYKRKNHRRDKKKH